MILGMTLSTFTFVHVIISLIGIGSGFVVLYGLFVGKHLNGVTAIFLLSTVLTSVTGFLFPFHHLLPSHKIGIISLVLLVIAILARYSFHLDGVWRSTYVVSAVMSLYAELFRSGGAGIHESPGIARTGSNRERAALPGY